MRYLWNITLEDYKEIMQRAKANGKKAGDSMEQEFVEYMKEKNREPLGATELSSDEWLKEQASHGLNPLGIEIDDKGKTTYKIIKKKKEK